MISYNEALDLIFQNSDINNISDLAIEKAIGYVLASDITSSINIMPFRNSAMDGFAVCAEWFKDCSESNRKVFNYSDTVYAGDSPQKKYRDNQVVKIMTGAPVPEGYDSVVMFEDTSYDDKKVEFHKVVMQEANVRGVGEDIKSGDLVFSKGHRLHQLDIGILASIGLKTIPVINKPSLLIASTGNELVLPGEPLPPGKIYNSNLFTISSMLSAFCKSVKTCAEVTDDEIALENILNSKEDVIITTGGVSAGERDLVVKTAEATGWQTVFHKIQIKPGKPVYFARRGKQLLFGLPGNPLSASVTCAIFMIPALKKICGFKKYKLQPLKAYLGNTPARKSKRLLIWPGKIYQHDGNTKADYSQKKSSAALTSLLNTDGIIFQQAQAEGGARDMEVEVVDWQQILN